MDLAKPGDRITVTGVYRAMGVRTNPRLRELKVRAVEGGAGQERQQGAAVWGATLGSPLRGVPALDPTPLLVPLVPPRVQAVYKTYIDVVHIQKDEASNLFSMFSADESQQSQGGERADARAHAADAPDTQDPGALLHTSNMTREEMEAKRAAFRVRRGRGCAWAGAAGACTAGPSAIVFQFCSTAADFRPSASLLCRSPMPLWPSPSPRTRPPLSPPHRSWRLTPTSMTGWPPPSRPPSGSWRM